MEKVTASVVIEEFGLPYFRELATFGALSDEVIVNLLSNGRIRRVSKGEYLRVPSDDGSGFRVVLAGKMAFYLRYEGRHVLTRYFCAGEQMGFDWMIGLTSREGTDVALEDTLLLDISSGQFFDLHVDYAADFGLLMINLSRELSREIAMLEDVIGKSTGWQPAPQEDEPSL